MDKLKTNKYYMMNITKGCNVTYMYTGDTATEGLYCAKIRGIYKHQHYIHTVIACVVPYTGNKNDILLNTFYAYENCVAISVLEETPTFTTPNDAFFKILNYQKSWFPCKPLPPENY